MYSEKCRDKVTVMKEEVILTDVYKQGAQHATQSQPHREAPGLVRRQRKRGGNVGKNGKEWAR